MPGRALPLHGGEERDSAAIANALRELQAHLEQGAPIDATEAQHVEDLVSQALAEIHRVRALTQLPPGASAPVLGAGVVTQLLKQRREGDPAPSDVPPKVDARR